MAGTKQKDGRGAVYCPYADKEVDPGDTTPDHIIPLSLGGHDDFTIPVLKTMNSTLGHSADAGLANDPLVLIRRAKLDARGHSKKPVLAIWKNTVSDAGMPLQAVIDKDGINFFDPRIGQPLPNSETAGNHFSSRFQIKQFSRLPFAAKVALGAGYFLFGDLFRSKVKHKELRTLLTPFEAIPKEVVRRNKITYFDRINDANHSRNDSCHKLFEAMISNVGGSSVLVTFGKNRIVFTIGILKEWEATISAPADDSAFPQRDDFDLGHFVILRKTGLIRMSLREAARQFQTALTNAGLGHQRRRDDA